MSRPADWHEVFGFGDPTPGEPWEVRRIARRWAGVADDAEYAEARLRGLLGDDAVVTWVGQAGDRFRDRSSELPSQLAKVKDSYRLASAAMTWWAGRLEQHQGDADTQLVRGREAKHDLERARARLGAAGTELDAASNLPEALAPSPEQVQQAAERLRAAQAAHRAADGLVHNTEARLAAARQLAAAAGEARRDDARETARRVRDAADAGLAPRSRWERIKDGASKVWDAVVTIAKIVVAVLGVVVLIIGGPLAWVVLAAALIVLVDALMKYADGEGSLLDVGLAALACIPGTKGLTTLAELSAAFKAGGALAAGAHVLGSAKSAVTSLALASSQLRRSLGPGVRAAFEVLGADGMRILPQLRTTVRDMTTAFTTTVRDGMRLQHEAFVFQGTRSYPGRDAWGVDRLMVGQQLEAGFPGIGQFALEGGTAARHGNQMRGVWESAQVGANLQHGYRGSMLVLQVESPVTALRGTVLANPHYGAGGATQYFLDIKEGVVGGHLSILDSAGAPVSLPPGTAVSDLDSVLRDPAGPIGGTGPITLGGPHTAGPGISTPDQVALRFPELPDSIELPPAGVADLGRLLRGIGYIGAAGPVVAR